MTNVVDTGDDKHHRAHPNDILAAACNPERRGTLVAEEHLDSERCQHIACFGGDDA